jgi:hypothetical protein
MELRQPRIHRRIGPRRRGAIGRALLFWLMPMLLVVALSMLAVARG